MSPLSSVLGRVRALSARDGIEPWLLSYLLLSVVVLAVWLPGGFNIGPISDGWINLNSGIWLSGHSGTRVLQYLPGELGQTLTPGCFVGWQLVLLALTLARGILVYEIALRLLDGQRAYALVCGLFALFHPMDHLYFWVDASNVDMAYALALAACLAALLHLRSGSYASLAAVWALQLASCLTYTGFVPIMGAFPVLVWLLWKLHGRQPAPVYLLRSTAATILFLIVMVLEARHGQGRESRVVSLHLAGIIHGYVYQLRTLGAGWRFWLASFRPTYFLPALVAGSIALGAAWRATLAVQEPLQTKRFYLLVAVMMVMLAGASYLPYAMSRLRTGHTRQMLAAGLFLLMAVLLPLFLWLSRTPFRRRIAAAMVGLIACGTVITGLETRAVFRDGYHAQEGVLASVAAAVPYPPASSIIVVQPDTAMRRDLRHSKLLGLSNRYQAFTAALRYMYNDSSLQGVFGDRYNRAGLRFSQDGILATGLSVPFRQLILLQRQSDGSMHVVDADALRQQVPAGTDLSAYRPGTYGGTPAPESNVCRMLQADYRPSYCR